MMILTLYFFSSNLSSFSLLQHWKDS